jgi:hypothetical protein
MRALTTIALSSLCVVSFASIGESRTRSVKTSSASACLLKCMISRGQILCPDFLVTTEHYPCVDYKMEQTACGWQLKRVLMCR